MSHFFTKKRIIILMATVVLAGGGYWFFARKKAPEFNYIVAKRGNLTQEVSVTGRVKPAKSVDLAFERSGKVGQVYKKVGDRVLAGQTMVVLENADISAQLLQAEANLDAAKAKLEELKKGTRPEELAAAKTAVVNAKDNLANIEAKAEADLGDNYDSALSIVQTAVNSARNSLYTLTDIQTVHFSGNDTDGIKIAAAKALAILELLGQPDSGRASNFLISTFEGGAFGLAQKAVNNPTPENIDAAIFKTKIALQRVKDALYAIPIIADLTSTEKTNLSAEKTNINTQITNVSNADQELNVQKAANTTAIATAKAALASAEDGLTIKQAGARPEQITAGEADVKSAEANVKNFSALLAKTFLKSPIDGVVTKQEAKVGEIISSNSIVVSIISGTVSAKNETSSDWEIEVNISEADIAKVKIGDTASLTLDAYGNDIEFKAVVAKIDPSETILEGVATYKTTLQFVDGDGRIKPGMTANIDILTATAKDVINVPQRVLYAKNGEKYVRVIDDGKIREAKVKTGLRGNDGYVEIKEGLLEGDKVIIIE
jgi:RND family efflux transporter MFP subunit